MSPQSQRVGDLLPVSALPELNLPKGKFWYVGTPYTKYRDGVEAAYVLARDVGEMLKMSGIPHFVPVVQSHEAAQNACIRLCDHDFFMAIDRPWMDRAHGLLVVGMDGWEESIGIAEEIRHFKAAGKPTLFLDPAVLLVTQ